MIEVSEKPKIAIVGAGPAGAFAALNLAKLGLAHRTAVFEEHYEIGKPSHCAGHLNIETIKMLGIKLPAKIIENEIKGAVFYSPSGLSFAVKREEPVTVVVNRELFDQAIAEEAEKLGVKFHLGCRVERLLIKKGKVAGIVVRNLREKTREDVYLKLVIDAEGVSAALLKKANFPYPNPENLVYGCQAIVDDVETVNQDFVEVYLSRKFAHGLFAWIIPRRDGTAKVGLAVKHGNPRRALFDFIYKHPVASEKLRKGRILRLSFHPIPLGGPIKKTYAHGLLVVGDAASQVKPTTGGGVLTGMICAKIAAKTAFKALNLNNFSEEFLAEYQREWKSKLGFEFKSMLRLRRMLDRLSDKQIDKLFQLCIKTDLNEILTKVGDVDFQGRTLLKAVLHPKSLIPLLHLIWLAITGR